jgi:glycosyltransferase involved in cell wall biosynthesis
MLIGIDASRATIAQRTGTENYSLYLIRALLAAGQAHHFRLYFNQAPEEGLFPRNERVVWRVMPCRRLWTQLRLSWEMVWQPPEVLFVPAHVLPLVHPPRCVATVHDLGYIHYPQAHTRWSRAYLAWATRYNARVARRVIVDSQATRDDLLHYYHTGADKIIVAYPAGVEGLAPVRDEDRLRAVRDRYGTGDRYFIYVGTIQPRKNLATLIRAFAGMGSSERGDARLVLVGKKGWLYEEILHLAVTLGLGDRVVFTDYVRSEDLPALLSGAWAYILPSWYEGFGLPVLEAMACETPVICSNVSSLPEVAGDAALLFDPHDEAALTQALTRISGDAALRTQLVQRGRERASSFSWGKCAQQVLTALESLRET